MPTRRTSISRMVQTILALLAGLLLWRSRFIQVVTFLAAARLGHSRNVATGSGPASNADNWSMLEIPAIAKRQLNPLVLVTYHAEYHAFDPRRAMDSLDAVTRLGVGWVRTDLRWREIMPDGTNQDPRALAWYRSFLNCASTQGLRNMVVLSTPPPFVLSQSSADRLQSWKRFVEVVISELGTWCDAYQLMNEPNNPVYRFFSLPDAAKALLLGRSIIHANGLKTPIAVNVSMEIWGWRKYLHNLLKLSGQSIEIVGLDHYPGTWTVGFQNHWADVFRLADEIVSARPDSPWFGRRLAIIETGFSTNTILRKEREQSEYFEALGNLLGKLKLRLPECDPIFGIYELCDWDSLASLDPEAHFGLMSTNLDPKLAFKTVANLVSALRRDGV